MKILEVMQKEAILDDLKSQNKKGVLEEIVVPLVGITGMSKENLARVLMERERLGACFSSMARNTRLCLGSFVRTSNFGLLHRGIITQDRALAALVAPHVGRCQNC